METIVGLNNKFSEIYDNLPFGRTDKYRYSEKLKSYVFSLRLLDNNWGNFCYCPEKFLVVSVGNSSVNPNLSSRRGIQIHVYGKVKTYWRSMLRTSILFNYDHKRDSLERSSSVFARSVVKRTASLDSVEEVCRYMDRVMDSRKDFTSSSWQELHG